MAEKQSRFGVYCPALPVGPYVKQRRRLMSDTVWKARAVDFFIFISQEWLLVSTLVVLIYVFAWRERLKGGRPISAHEVTRLLNSEEAVLLDVRSESEFKAGHIVDAVHIPHTKVASQMERLEGYRDKIVVVVDKLGQHAGAVGRALGKAGFEVRRLSGGMAEWRSQNMPLVKD